ncbi:hypothetical protein GGR57DRAFT_473250 [Xylariaceae sp. FL1272]|nr:hypothetical protein GGR57DRAFT_473250 [Xylariaceae sp. FL1272]
MAGPDFSNTPYTGKGNTPRGRARLPSSRRRDKPIFSCNLCRRRKLRCDRERPCGSCVQRCISLSCTYQSDAPAADTIAGKRQEGNLPVPLHGRIQQLESLVIDLIQKAGEQSTPNQDPVPSGCSTPDRVPRAKDSPIEYGSMTSDDKGSTYVNNAHWAAVLDGISELKDHFKAEEYDRTAPTDADITSINFPRPQLLFPRTTSYPSKQDILASLPPLNVMDRLVSRFFNTFDMSTAVIHGPQFLKEYADFRESPSSVSYLWLGLLCAILCLAAQFQVARQTDTDHQHQTASNSTDWPSLAESFNQKTVECLILGKYTHGGPYALEALMLYLSGEYLSHRDAEIGIWYVAGMIVQLALHMGLHRDPKHFENISPFEGEMRRRIWATIIEIDLGISAQIGLPRIIRIWQTDTELPRNILESDLEKKSKELPPARPDSELTPILCRIVKAQLTACLGLIWDFSGEIRRHSYDAVMAMDNKLEETRRAIPECLQWVSFTHCITDSPQILLYRVCLNMMFWKSKICLHRKYLALGYKETDYAYSRDACLGAALKLLEFHHFLAEETKPLCQLHEERWRISSILNQDFLLGASILCSHLQQITKDEHEGTETGDLSAIVTALTRSRDIWILSASTSKESMRGFRAIDFILERRQAVLRATSRATESPQGMRTLAGFDEPATYPGVHDFGIPSSYSDFPALGNLSLLSDQPVTHPLSILNTTEWPWGF